MPQYIVLRIYPDQPVNGSDFTTFLTGLSINVFDRSYNHPDGALIGTAFYDPNNPAANIIQHFWKKTTVPKATHLESVATAVIEVPAGPEFINLDIKVVVQRNGQKLREFDWHDNVATLTANAPPPHANYLTLSPVSAFLAIPGPLQAVDPALAHIELTSDGVPPSFDRLQTAINIVVAANPTIAPNLSSLTVAQSLALAYAITWDHALYSFPLLPPTPVMNLEVMYTLDYVYPPNGTVARNASAAQNAINIFTTVHTTQWNNAATRMSQYVYAYSAALFCAQTSRNATSALLEVPVHTASKPQLDKITEALINLQFTPSASLNFEVPAAYFYVLTLALPTSMGPAARYQQAVGDDPATNLSSLQDAINAGTIVADANINLAQAVRRLDALEAQNGALVALVNTQATIALVVAWLAFTGDDIAVFWSIAVATPPPHQTVGGPQLAGQLELMLEVVTDDQLPLMSAVLAIPIANVDQLADLTENDWKAFFKTNVGLLSPTLLPGAAANERVMAFINGLRRFYTVKLVAEPVPVIPPAVPPQFDAPAADLIHQFSASYEHLAGTAFSFATGGDASQVAAAISAVAAEDSCVKEWLTRVIQTAVELHQVAPVPPVVSDELSFSIMEALYARGFTTKASIRNLSREDFTESLTGSVAFQFAEIIFEKARGKSQVVEKTPEPFKPINPDGLLTNCIPPAELSPLGPVAYLHEVLRVSGASTCADPTPESGPAPASPGNTLAGLLASRRGPLGNLAVTQSNLETPIPMVDMVNECLEAMVAGSTHGVVYDTASVSLLSPPGSPADGHSDLHDPVVLLGALPEHSSPATPVKSPLAYDKLRQDFSAPGLPYSQALDINREYLKHLGTSRFEVMKSFRKEVREFLQDPDPAKEPAGFERYLVRKPYPPELFCEYLGISPEEYNALFTNVTASQSSGLFGYGPPPATPANWTTEVSQLSEFLKRTGLTYCEFIELWKSQYVRFRNRGDQHEQGFPACEPCCLQDVSIVFDDTQVANQDVEALLLRLAIFIRLWRKLQALRNAKYSFAQLRDICDVLEMFHPNGSNNPDFIRQLAAFQMLRDDLHLRLTDKDDEGAPPNPIDADRTHLLALWVGPTARKYSWAVRHLLHQVQSFAERHHGCGRRAPEFIKLLKDNLRPLAVLCGADPWDKKPTHTLRFTEVLEKIYASEFTVGEILFIFTNESHLDGDDPFALATAEETNDSPLDLPDDDEHFSLWALRRKLLAVEICDAEAAAWTWTRIEESLRREFGYVQPSSGADPLISLGQHFFPSILRHDGHSVPSGGSQYRVPLAAQSAAMWNTPLDGPFRYDSHGSGELWTQLPLKDEAVLAKLSGLRQLNQAERDAVRDLYFLPRVDLARFAFIFANFGEAERKLIQEGDEKARWEFFQREFARCHKRCKVIAEHLAGHGAGLHHESHDKASHHREDCEHESHQHEHKEACEHESHHHEHKEACEHESHHHDHNEACEHESHHHEHREACEHESHHHEHTEACEHESHHHEHTEACEHEPQHHEHKEACEHESHHHEHKEACELESHRHEHKEASEHESHHHEHKEGCEHESHHHEHKEASEHESRHHEHGEACEHESHHHHESHQKESCHKESREKERKHRTALAWKVLRHLLADENRAASSWEDDSGHAPPGCGQVTGGGAFAALLGLTGTGLVSEFRVAGSNQVVWRELRGGMRAFSATRNEWNAPLPTVIPAMDLTISNDAQLFSSVRNGLGFANANAERLGGLQGFSVTWKGSLLIEKGGRYQFWAGTPAEAGGSPEHSKEGHCRWRLLLKRGQKEIALLGHQWQADEPSVYCAEGVALRRGVYRLEIVFEQPQPRHLQQEDICPQRTGFEVKYKGPDTDECIATLPFDRLFQERKNQQLSNSLKLTGEASAFLGSLFTSSLRDIRRTYERALKSFLFADRLRLSAKGISYEGHSEIGYLLDHPSRFAGTAYYLDSGTYKPHSADFDFDFLPVDDIYSPDFDYTPPATVLDERALNDSSIPAASRKRPEALFDIWERIFDYSVLRRATRKAPERPVWLLFHEATANQPDEPFQLLGHMRVNISHSQAVLGYFNAYSVATADLEDERWPVRAWRADRLIDRVMSRFFSKDIRDAKPDLWAADDPPGLAAGNANLTRFVCDGSFENNQPRRYKHLKLVNDGLRDRARKALLAYLCARDRVTLPDGTKAHEARHLSELLLLDVEVGLCEKASRIEEAITAVQLYVQRARLGLEPGLKPGSEFLRVWERHFLTFRAWEACKRRDVYRENVIEWEELEKARTTEAFRFLEDQLRRASLTSPAPGGVEYWPPKALPAHEGVTLIQKREPSSLQRFQPQREGLEILGTPERHARPAWLAKVDRKSDATASALSQSSSGCLPLWIEAAIRLGTRFVRVAAAGVPPASVDICKAEDHTGCCSECGKVHNPFLDEYYFWLIDTRHFTPPRPSEPYQDPLWAWHDQSQLPGLLNWDSNSMVHLAWCRFHNGEFQQPRRSSEGVRKDLTVGAAPFDLVFMGRSGDSLRFKVNPPSPDPGFRYDLATDSAVVLPLLVNSLAPAPQFGLSSYPFFLYFRAGASLYPDSCFSPSLAIGDHLRAHCRFEEALKWYDRAYAPLERDNQWAKCLPVVATTFDAASIGKDPAVLAAVPPNGTKPPVSESKCCDSTDVKDESVFRNRAIALRYIETLLQWADSLMCQNTPEAFQKARLILDTARRIMGDSPRTIAEPSDLKAPPQTVASFAPHIAPLNPRLLSAYERVQNRISRIQHCFNGRRLRSGVPNKDMPYWGNSALRDGWKTNVTVCEEDVCCLPCKPYRFTVLVKQAQDLANEVKGLGSALLAAYEKGDSEYLASLRSVHENQLHALTLSIRQNQWREADWQVQALRKTKESAQLRRTYNNNLFIANLIWLEHQYENQSITSINWRIASNVIEVFSNLLRATPDVNVGQINFFHLLSGSKAADVGAAVARAFGALSEYYGSEASLNLTRAGWERRRVEWAHQVQVLDIEIQQIEDQIDAAERRRDISLRELNNHQRQMEQSGEVLDFLRDKFTNDALYLWMQKETAALYYKAYELALHSARSAERAFNNERGHTTRSFIPKDAWDNLHEGLVAGDQLQVALKQMETAYYDENCREYELSKHVSLRLHSPLEFLKLKATGRCEIELPEWLFDHDYPDQYMRRIKSVSLTLPCVVGPYIGVHCRLTLLSSATRVDPRLSDEGEACCRTSCGCGGGYAAKPDDARVVRQYSAVEAVATSSGQNDSGLFELNFRDERYLPFEGAGAASRWRLELPPENNYFDLDSLSDVVLHLNYTAREGGEPLRAAAHCEAAKHLPGNGLRLFDARHDFPNAWHVFSDSKDCDCRYLEVRLSRRMFPFVPGNPSLQLGEVHVFYETDCAIPSRHQTIELLDRESAKYCPPHSECKPERIECVASAEWPNLFHGVIAGHELPLEPDCDVHLGSLRFPREVPSVRRVYFVVRYGRCDSAPLACPEEASPHSSGLRLHQPDRVTIGD